MSSIIHILIVILNTTQGIVVNYYEMPSHEYCESVVEILKQDEKIKEGIVDLQCVDRETV